MQQKLNKNMVIDLKLKNGEIFEVIEVVKGDNDNWCSSWYCRGNW